MAIHLDREIQQLKRLILQQSARVEESLRRAVSAVEKRDVDDAKAVISIDYDIDQNEIFIEEECLKILALHQPVANDLRYVISCMKMNNDLERVADLAALIAENAIAIASFKRDKTPVDVEPMMEKTLSSLEICLDAFIRMEVDVAKKAIDARAEVDDLGARMCDELEKRLQKKPKKSLFFINFMNTVKHLERVAACASNIAEDVVYMITGEIIRHTNNDANGK